MYISMLFSTLETYTLLVRVCSVHNSLTPHIGEVVSEVRAESIRKGKESDKEGEIVNM